MKKIAMLVYILLCSNLLVSQTNNAFQNYTSKLTSLPHSPSSYEFNRYGNIGLSEYTGTPQINVPLYTIEEGEINIPITLNYRSGGIKVNEESSWVGLGWDLSFGGIYQVINDIDDLINQPSSPTALKYHKIRPDFANANPGMINYYPKPSHVYFGSNAFLGVGHPIPQTPVVNNGSIMKSYDSHVPINGVYVKNAQIFTNQDYDSEPDFFTANFFGHKVDFIFDFKDGSVRVLNERGYKIELIEDGNNDGNIKGYDFIITTPDGLQYYFEKDERILRYDSNPGFGDFHRIRSRKWKITKIRDTKNNEVNFDYETISNAINFPNYSQTYTENLFTRSFGPLHGSGGHLSNANDREFDYYGGGSPYEQYVPHTKGATKLATYYDATQQNIYLPSKITWSAGSINFSTSSRIDKNNSRKLDLINIHNGKKNVKTFSFNYGYFNSQSGYNIVKTGTGGNITHLYNYTSDEKNKRLKLNSINENTIKEYSFKYNNMALPPKNATALDYWGYFNGKNNLSLVPNLTDVKPTYDVKSNGNDKNPSLEHAKACVLEEIKYPTKGYTRFEYELNSGENYFVVSSNKLPTTGNGLRLKKQISYSSLDVKSLETSYSYFDGKSLLPINPVKEYQVYHGNDVVAQMHGSNDHYYSANILETSSSNMLYMNSFSGDDFVGYGKVIIENKGLNVTNGKNIKYFQNKSGSTPLVNGKYNSILSRKRRELENGKLLKEEIYDVGNKKVAKNTYTYNYISSPIDYGVKISNAGAHFYVWRSTNADLNTVVPYSVHLLFHYPIFSGKTMSKSIEKTMYYQNDSIKTFTTYKYDSYHRKSKEEINNLTDSSILSTDYRYQDGADFTSKNILTKPSFISQKKSSYLGVGILNTESYNFNIDSTTGKVLLNEKIMCNDNEVDCNKMIYEEYDDKGNVLQYKVENGISTVLLWGYNKNYPIAKIENATLSEIAGALGVSAMVLKSYNENQLANINNLRTLLDKSLITTYTHDPLVGVTSITDQRGEIMYYSYDDLNRLKYVKDSQGNILKENRYDYKN
ncbi:hypothetical protein [Tenacibaculum aiptasiae]|uniref:hypothetical protein n=1 Tax=Tenacibaculum aiptasiae TaxID=426481 RepID=UPI00232D50F4|nr:hypothetical protein [Tenacibaculum aiptasiae]